jgi:O-acetyl-ADP-ribose deacetylase (regulator of RNase III)
MAICRQLQRAAYLGTLLAAAALGHSRVVLTLIGGGVFANPIGVIWDAIGWAVDQVGHFLHRDLLVVVNGRNLGEQLPPRELAVAARERGGGVLRLARSGPAQLDA